MDNAFYATYTVKEAVLYFKAYNRQPSKPITSFSTSYTNYATFQHSQIVCEKNKGQHYEVKVRVRTPQLPAKRGEGRPFGFETQPRDPAMTITPSIFLRVPDLLFLRLEHRLYGDEVGNLVSEVTSLAITLRIVAE